MSAAEKSRARGKLIVALDVASADAATRVAQRLRGRVGMFKVGSELFTAEGPVVAHHLVSQGEKVFLDLKFHDIPHTVRAAARQAARLGVSMLDVHAAGGRKMMEAALEGVREGSSGAGRPLVLAVTLLTSLGSEDLQDLGIAGKPDEAAIRLARMARNAGFDGVIASPQEATAIRAACGPDFVIVTPGIRPAAAHADDQARIATPAEAIQAGADFLVVGRPITEAPDPAAAADAIVEEMAKALVPSQVRLKIPEQT